MGNQFDAEDITQEVFLSVYKKLSDFDRNYEKAWICKIASNKCLDFLKRAGRRSIPTEETYFQDIPEPNFLPEEKYLAYEAKQRVYTLCNQLKSPYKEAALQHFYQELSVQEIAANTGKNVKTIQTHIYRAKAMLRKQIGRKEWLDAY